MALRVGVLCIGLDHTTEAAFRVLAVQMNRLQADFEFSLLESHDDEPLLAALQGGALLEWRSQQAGHSLAELVPSLATRYDVEPIGPGEPAAPAPNGSAFRPAWLVVVSTARYSDNWYSHRATPASVLCLGLWDRHCAPPSVVDFLLTLLVREAIAAAVPSFRRSGHDATKGCLLDHTGRLTDARLKALNAFICSDCQHAIDQHRPGLSASSLRLLRRDWLGRSDDPKSPAGMAANLGYDLFQSRGLKPTTRERLALKLEDETIKMIVSVVGALVLVALGAVLGVTLK